MDPDFPTRFNLSVVDLDEDGKCPKLCEMRTFENDAQEKMEILRKIYVRLHTRSDECVIDLRARFNRSRRGG